MQNGWLLWRVAKKVTKNYAFWINTLPLLLRVLKGKLKESVISGKEMLEALRHYENNIIIAKTALALGSDCSVWLGL